MRATRLKWGAALALATIAYQVLPDLWHGRLPGLPVYETPWLPRPGEVVDDPRAALGALILLDYARDPWVAEFGNPYLRSGPRVASATAPPELLAAALADEELRPLVLDLVLTGPVHGEPMELPDGVAQTEPDSWYRRAHRLCEDPNWQIGLMTDAQIEARLEAIESLIDEGVPTHAAIVRECAERYLRLRGAPEQHARALSSLCSGFHALNSPVVRLAPLSRYLLVRNAPLRERLRSASERLAAVAAPPADVWVLGRRVPRHDLDKGDLYGVLWQNRFAAQVAGIGAGITAAWLLMAAWVLLAWVCLRRRTGNLEEPPRLGRAGVLAWLILPAGVAGLIVCFRSPSLAALGFAFVAGAVAAGDAIQRGARRPAAERAARLRARALDLLAVVVLMAAAFGGAVFWAGVGGLSEPDFGSIILETLHCTLTLVLVGMAGTALLWGRERTHIEAMLPRLLGGLVLAALAVVTVTGVTREAGAGALLASPLAGLVWVAVYGVLYWFLRQIRLGGKRFRPESLTAPVLLAGAIVALLAAILLAPPKLLDLYLGPGMILTMIALILPLVDGALRRAALTDGCANRSATQGTAAWSAALADGLVVLTAALLALAVGARVLCQQGKLGMPGGW